ncbi:hypothetical protein [Streptomyces sp. Cmuel-A718b]|uniref:hypothetical protein n=1 Tax=Streptomyces sp. Cmuel-A718b TaxID=697328 RepID=UPI00081D3762|nr:hypothetical protein [Streptomyces sp. Cmuel-A718b]SCF88679.1 hypothetical protein GA0115280_118247 [Streptomyces sp. Cmuel-A718b]
MREEQTTMADPVALSLPSARPEPVPGCRDCLGLAVQRVNAGSAGDYSKVSDMNVTLRGHLRDAHGDER